jgi:hypothetical protein
MDILALASRASTIAAIAVNASFFIEEKKLLQSG